FYEAQKFKVRSMRLFEALERLLDARPGHKADFSFRAASLEDTLARAARRLALGMTAGFGFLASALTAASERVPRWTPIGFGVVAAALLAALVVDLARGAPSPRPVDDQA